jgi:hypothetical protein
VLLIVLGYQAHGKGFGFCHKLWKKIGGRLIVAKERAKAGEVGLSAVGVGENGFPLSCPPLRPILSGAASTSPNLLPDGQLSPPSASPVRSEGISQNSVGQLISRGLEFDQFHCFSRPAALLKSGGDTRRLRLRRGMRARRRGESRFLVIRKGNGATV